jgi:hypothetical protein
MTVFRGVTLSHNLTGNATLFVDAVGSLALAYNCLDPAVPPWNPLC